MKFSNRSLYLLVSVLVFSLFSSISAHAYSSRELNFLKIVKRAQDPSLKKNTDKELIEIAKTLCGDEYPRAELLAIYKKNHFTQKTSAFKLLTKAAQSGICTTRVEVLDSNGNSSWVYVYDESTTVIDAGVIIGSGGGASEALSKASKPLNNSSSTNLPAQKTAPVKFKNCAEAKAAGAAPLNKSINPDLYNLNSGLDRDKDGIACEI